MNLSPGMNRLSVSTGLDCQGVYEEEIFVSEKIQVYPNPTNGPLSIYVAGNDRSVNIEIRSINGSIVYNNPHSVKWNRTLDIDVSSLQNGIYILSVIGETVDTSHKIVKT